MIKLLTIPISISLFLISCSNNNLETINENTTNKIVTACITEMIGTGETAAMSFMMPPNELAIDYPNNKEQYKHEYDSIKKVTLSINPFIVVADTLTGVAGDTSSVKEILTDARINKKIDTTGYAGLVPNKNFKKIDTNYIAQQIRIKVTNKEPWQKGEELHYHNKRFIAVFDFSRLMYSGNKAFVSGSKWCGGLCGYNYYMFLQKINNSWQVVSFIKTSES